MTKINYEYISAQHAAEQKHRAIASELDRIGPENVSLEECLINKDRYGLLIIQKLIDIHNENHNLFYKIKVLQDIWGEKVLPGQKIQWKYKIRHRDTFGKKLSMKEIKAIYRRGEGHKIDVYHSAVVDSKGCINVPIEDALILLDLNGVTAHGEPICQKPEKTKEIKDAQGRLVKPAQHFWLYQEVSQEDYETLPEKNKKEKKE